jgi:hypothetical protein
MIIKVKPDRDNIAPPLKKCIYKANPSASERAPKAPTIGHGLGVIM